MVWLISIECADLLINSMVKNVVYYICLIIWQQVNELRDSATQIEEEIDKTKNSMHQNKVDVARLKGQLERMDTKDPKYVSRRAISVTGYVTVSSVYSLKIVRNCFIRVLKMSKLITKEHIATLIETSVLNTNDTALIYWQSEVAIFSIL